MFLSQEFSLIAKYGTRGLVSVIYICFVVVVWIALDRGSVVVEDGLVGLVS